MSSRTVIASLLLASCAADRAKEDPTDWYSGPSDYDVQEPVEFTDEPYDVQGATAIGDIPRPNEFETWFADGEQLPEGDCNSWFTKTSLPVEITGIVTAHPRYYFKASGCRPSDDFSIDSDEKYYGSYFIEDETGGIFVLGDSKVAHFDMGDRVTLRIRATKELFGQSMVYSHDVVSIDRGPYPVYFEERDTLTREDLHQVRRLTGTVGFSGGFGEVQVCIGDVQDDDFEDVYADSNGQTELGPQIRCVNEGRGFYLALDTELQRRGFELETGTRITATGPVIKGFDTDAPNDEWRVVITRLGQIEYHED